MGVLYLILFLLAAGCFAAAAFNVAAVRVNLLALGLLLWVAVDVIQQAKRV